MELYHLRSFIAVANEGHLSRAAKRLYISQPAVSAHIKNLEEELGVALFERTPQGMRLTKEGNLLRSQAEKTLSSIHELFQQAKSLRQDLTATVKISLNSEPDFLKTGELAAVLREQYPQLEVHLLQRRSWEALDGIKNGDLDVGFFFGDNPLPEITRHVCHTYQLVVVGPAKWKTQLTQCDWAGLAELPWIWGAGICPYYLELNERFAAHQVTPVCVAQADNEAGLKTLVASGTGLAVLLEEDAIRGVQEGKLCIWPKERFEVVLSFGYLRERAADPVIQAVLNGLYIVWGLPACRTIQYAG